MNARQHMHPITYPAHGTGPWTYCILLDVDPLTDTCDKITPDRITSDNITREEAWNLYCRLDDSAFIARYQQRVECCPRWEIWAQDDVCPDGGSYFALPDEIVIKNLPIPKGL